MTKRTADRPEAATAAAAPTAAVPPDEDQPAEAPAAEQSGSEQPAAAQSGAEHTAAAAQSAAAQPIPGPARAAPDFRTALVSSITVDLPNQHPTVVLRESESPRRQLSFSVSLQDGTVLSHAVRRIATPRPLTHELLSEVLAGFDIDVVAVRLVGRKGAVYFAELDLRGRSGRSVHSCRPSDALAVALLQPVPVPILIDARLLEEEGDVVPPGPPAPSDATE